MNGKKWGHLLSTPDPIAAPSFDETESHRRYCKQQLKAKTHSSLIHPHVMAQLHQWVSIIGLECKITFYKYEFERIEAFRLAHNPSKWTTTGKKLQLDPPVDKHDCQVDEAGVEHSKQIYQ